MNVITFDVPQSVHTDPIDIPLVGGDVINNANVEIRSSNVNKLDDTHILFFCDEESESNDAITNLCYRLSDRMKLVDDIYSELVTQIMIDRDFKGKLGDSITLCTKEYPNYQFLSVLGCGLKENFQTSSLNELAVEIVNIIKKFSSKSISLYVDSSHLNGQLSSRYTPMQIRCLLENVLLQLSADNRFKSNKSSKPSSLLRCITIYSNEVESVMKVVDRAKIDSQATFFAIQLVNAPSNYCNTCSLANAAIEMALKHSLQAKVLDLNEIEKLNMGCYLGVAKGSMFPPKFIHLSYKAEGNIRHKIAFVGKGICFDSGGYNIKNASSLIELMKFDMAGAAAVFGAAMAIGMIKPPNVEVHFIVAAAENMVSKFSYRPGDVLVASNLKTVEVGNTDAEGRLTLADSLVYAENLGVDLIVDIATLTGACVVALGDKIAGLFTPYENVAEEIISCSQTVGERLWRMPVAMEYRSAFNSKLADMNNVSTNGKGGSIIAALFLKEFVQKTPWAHIDIAGTAWDSSDGKATGYGTRTLTELVIKRSKNS